MILTFIHEFLSCELVMLSFFAILINVENDSKNVFNFKFFDNIFFFETIIFHSWKNVFDSINVVTTNLKISRIICNFFTKYNNTLMQRVKLIYFFYFYFAIRCLRDVFSIFAYFALFVFVCDVEIIIIHTMFFNVYFVYNNYFIIFVDMFIFLTIKTLL
jgi:hypothetical protein